jgi:ABC-type nickel/cobalt efflux system permease component RcnA
MHINLFGSEWQKTIWKILRNPTFEVIAAIVVVLFATWLIVQTETDLRQHTPFPVPTGVR